MKMKLPSLEGVVITIKSDQKEAKRCYENNLKMKKGVLSVTTRPPREDGVTCVEIAQENQPEPVGGVVEREIGGKTFKLGRSLSKEDSQDLVAEVIARHLDAFAWLANVILVKKASKKWRICVDFTDLNKACPKDSYPLLSIDALMDNTSGCRLLSFLDAFSGYNQIMMHPSD